jgi:holo-[acyl-carrier protein] synthase
MKESIMAETIIGIGIDITEVTRLRKAIEKWGESFSHRIFTEKELAIAQDKINKYQHLAGRFAAKEAIYKAVGDSTIGFKDIEIINDKAGKPCCSFRNGKGRNILINVSISHVKTYAVANAIATKKA